MASVTFPFHSQPIEPKEVLLIKKKKEKKQKNGPTILWCEIAYHMPNFWGCSPFSIKVHRFSLAHILYLTCRLKHPVYNMIIIITIIFLLLLLLSNLISLIFF